ncbi:bifunctional 4-hydroxy-2-oxoglutarate aldolase/2-dehydro-3-deoxy-phosphogluconate aldolase [Vibrio sp. DNB22_10_4]
MKLSNIAEKYPLIPVAVINDLYDVLPLCDLLTRNNLPVIEIVLRTSCALDAISEAKASYPNLTVIAGSVKNPHQARAAQAAGADIIVSAGLNLSTIEACKELGIEIVPGVNNASDIERGLNVGINSMKFFPAEASGGIPMLKALSSVYSEVNFMPTGGLSMKNVTQYLELNSVLCCGASWFIDSELIKEKNWAGIEAKVQEAIEITSQN